MHVLKLHAMGAQDYTYEDSLPGVMALQVIKRCTGYVPLICVASASLSHKRQVWCHKRPNYRRPAYHLG